LFTSGITHLSLYKHWQNWENLDVTIKSIMLNVNMMNVVAPN
jgi:hypothetical protein